MADSTAKTGAKPRRSRSKASADPDQAWLQDVQRFSFQEARTALELAMAQLQAADLEVEQMAGLYRRAQACADRCQAVLESVEQEVIEWEALTS